ncbi:MAG: energy transducer TonB [Flavobacterium sp.]|nr:MAG: energy transducer TonB [Flavobacterium sp.]
MSKVSVFDNGWTDLVFEGRNKSYGAYQLRRQDPKTTMIALFSGIALIGLLIAIPASINHFKADVVASPEPYVLPDATVVNLKELPKELPKPEPLKPDPVQQEPAGAVASSTPQVKFSTPVVTASTTPVDLPSTTDFQNANPGSHDDPGDNNGNIAIGSNGSTSGTATTGTGIDTGPGAIVHAGNVDEAPVFPGGLNKFYAMVGDRFKTPDSESRMTVKVHVYFVVEKDGTMTNIKVVNNPGENLEREALRVLKSIRTKWKPGKKGGEYVRTAYNLPITVNVN